MHHSQINSEVRKLIADGTVMPAHPLALTAERQLDKTHQRALTRYYIDAGSGWNIERPFQRMRFGSAAAQAVETPFAVAGPEFG